jgi:hypothetical protein
VFALDGDTLEAATELLLLNAARVRSLVTTGNPPSLEALNEAVLKTLDRTSPRSISEMKAKVLQGKQLAQLMQRPEWQDLALKLGQDTTGYLQRGEPRPGRSAFVPSLEAAVEASFEKDRMFLRTQARALDLDPTELFNRYKSICLRTGVASNRVTLITSLGEQEVNQFANPTRGQMVCARGTFSFGYYTLLRNQSPFRVAHDFYGVAVRSKTDGAGETSQVFFPRICMEGAVFDRLAAHPVGVGFLGRLKTIATLTDHDYLHVLDLALAIDIASSSGSHRLRSAALRLPHANKQRGLHMDSPPHKRSYEYEIMNLHREALHQINHDGGGLMWKRLHDHFVDVCHQLNELHTEGALSWSEATACLLVYCNFFRLAKDLGTSEIEAQRDCLPIPEFDLQARYAKRKHFSHTDSITGGLSPEALRQASKRWFVEQLSLSWSLLDRCL